MRVAPGSTDQLFADWGTSGATLGVRVDDLEGNTTIARTTGFVENPAGSGLYYLDPFTFPEEPGSYVLIYDDDGGTYAVGHTGSEELIVSELPNEVVEGDLYATVDELLRILKIRNPTDEQRDVAERVMFAAAGEIRDEIDADPDGDFELSGEQLALVAEVNLERAAELWKLEEVTFGLVGLATDVGPTRIARDTWEKYAITLSRVKQRWGIA